MSRKLETLVLAALISLVALLSAPRGAAAASRSTEARSVEFDGIERSYLLHVPQDLPRERPTPLVLVFHGGGGVPIYAERETGFSELADREGFLVAYPEGIGRGWNDGRGVEAIGAQSEGLDDVGFVAALIDDVARVHPVDPDRVYATGISNGAMFSHYLGANLASRIAAIAPVAGGLPEPVAARFRPGEPVAVLILNGSDDPLVPYGGGEITPLGKLGKARGRILATDAAARRWAAHDGCAGEPTAEDLADQDPGDGCRVHRLTWTGGRDGTEVVVYRLDGAGHTWPAGRQYLPERLIGTVCRELDGAEVVWEFFRRHPKRRSAPGAAAEAVSGAGPESPPPGWTLVWADEFDGEVLDRESWTVAVVADRHNEELQFYPGRADAEPGANLWLEDGVLVIEARREDYEHRRYTSGRIDTRGKREFLYGRFEARIRQPGEVGMWPAFWLLGANVREVGWPACGLTASGRLDRPAMAGARPRRR